MYIYTVYPSLRPNECEAHWLRIWIWFWASIKARHLLRCSQFVCLFLGFTWTPRHVDSFRSPWSEDLGANIWAVSRMGETNSCWRFFYFVQQLVGMVFFFFSEGWLKGLFLTNKPNHHGVSGRQIIICTFNSSEHLMHIWWNIWRLLTKNLFCPNPGRKMSLHYRNNYI